MGGCYMRGDELERYAKQFCEERIDLNDRQARNLARDLLHENALLEQRAKAAEQALEGVVRGQKA